MKLSDRKKCEWNSHYWGCAHPHNNERVGTLPPHTCKKVVCPLEKPKRDPRFLGIPNINFSLAKRTDNREPKFRAQRLERGFDDSEIWSLRDVFARFIAPRLRRYREVVGGHPGDMTLEEWKGAIGKMIEAFELISREGEGETLTEKDWDVCFEGLDLFCHHYMALWC